jgi:hypothetical protein
LSVVLVTRSDRSSRITASGIFVLKGETQGAWSRRNTPETRALSFD